jgi:high affinity Mn2+ porin
MSQNIHGARRAFLVWLVMIAAIQMASAAPPTTQPTDQTSTMGSGAAEIPATQPTLSAPENEVNGPSQNWNFHGQNTDIVQGTPAFSADYSGPNSLDKDGQVEHTESIDLYGGLRLWSGAEAHIDGLAWNGQGLSDTAGVEDFPNGEAYKSGTHSLDFTFARLFLRQTINLGGPTESVPDDELDLAGTRDVSRLTFTIGRFTPSDQFDTNDFANDPRRQFMNWAFINNVTWDYPADSIGYTTGFSVELNQPNWAARYGFFQMPADSNSDTAEDRYLFYPRADSESDGEFFKSWGMMLEFQRNYTLLSQPGVIRVMPWVDLAHMGLYSEAPSEPGDDITLTRAYRFKYGFAANLQQQIVNDIALFARGGWNDGREEAWAYTDVNYSGSLGFSVNGDLWHRSNDALGLAAVFSGISHENREFLEAGGTGILDGDGALSYGWEKAAEFYYAFDVWQSLILTLDYQFIADPAFNRDRGPVSVLGARLHWEF